MNINGMKIIEDINMTEEGEPYQIRRSWKERLFSRPWRPRQRMKTIVPRVPSEKCYLLGNNTIMMHPETAQKLFVKIRGAGFDCWEIKSF